MSQPAVILVLNGPNLNMLGRREPEVYGRATLADIEAAVAERARGLGFEVDFRQSNSEGELIGWIQEARDGCAAIIVNAGALTHTSIGLLDALRAFEGPIVEVHLSNIFRREPYRRTSYVAEVATGSICGFGARGYLMAVDAVADMLAEREGT